MSTIKISWWCLSQRGYLVAVLAMIVINLVALALSYLPGFYDAALTTIWLTIPLCVPLMLARYVGLGYLARWLILPCALLGVGLLFWVGRTVTAITGAGTPSTTALDQLAFAGLGLSLAWFGAIALLGLLPNHVAGAAALKKRFGLRPKPGAEA